MIGDKLYRTGKLKVKQHYKYDCGAACLASIAAFYGIKESLAHIRLLCGCTPQGISMLGLIDGATALGLSAKGYCSPQKELKHIKELETPVIAHIVDKEGFYHYVTVYSVEKEKVKIMDPATGDFIRLPHLEFKSMWSGNIIVIVPGNNFAHCKKGETKGMLHTIFSLAKYNLTEILLAFGGTVLCTATSISTTFLLQQLIDNILPMGERLWITIAGVLAFILMVCSLYLGYATARYLIRSSIKIETALTAQYLEKLLKLPAGFFNNYTAGDLASRRDDIHNIRSLVTEGIIGTLTSIITVIASLAIMLLYNPILAAIIMLFIPGYWGLFKLSGYFNKKYSKDIAMANSAFETQLLEQISAMECIRHYNASLFAGESIGKRLTLLMRQTNHLAGIANIMGICTMGLSRLLICIILTVGSASVLKGEMSIGELVGFYSLCSFLTVPLDNIIRAAELISKAEVSYRRVSEIILLPDEFSHSADKLSPIGLCGDIVVDNIEFRFPGRDCLFNRMSITFPQGQITAITGESGCGKSTLAKLILGDWSATAGSISFAGVNIAQFAPALWRNMIGYVPQRGCLLNTTLLNNITMGEVSPSIDKVVQICSELKMTYMIEQFPQGLLTVAGEGGNGLSGGECQKIAIARAMYKDPQIFIFDEITSSLDKESEKCVMECLKRLKRRNKTIIIITHKLDNLEIADNIVHIG